MVYLVKVVGSHTEEFPPSFLRFNWQDLPPARFIWPLLEGTDSWDFACESVWRGCGTFPVNGTVPSVYGEFNAVY